MSDIEPKVIEEPEPVEPEPVDPGFIPDLPVVPDPVKPDPVKPDPVLPDPEPPKRRRTDAILREVTTRAPEAILRDLRGYDLTLPDWVPVAARQPLAPIWAAVVTAARSLPELVDEEDLALGDKVTVHRAETNAVVASGRFLAVLDNVIHVATDDGTAGQYDMASFVLARR